jgi:hypothetical protein
MKKLLILIVAGALYFHFYPNEKLNDWLFEQKAVALSFFSEATDTQVRLNPDKIYQDLSRHFDKFTTREQNFIAEMTSTREKVKSFYQKYCLGKKQTPKLHRDNLTEVCKTITHYSRYF